VYYFYKIRILNLNYVLDTYSIGTSVSHYAPEAPLESVDGAYTYLLILKTKLTMKTINNNIQEQYCSFEVSKLLKDYGFDGKSNSEMGFKLDGQVSYDILVDVMNGNGIYSPTHEIAIEWVRINHGVWISVDWMTRTKPYNSGFICHLRGTNNKINQDNFLVVNDTLEPGYEVFNTPQEANEAALLYTLNNLINFT